MAELTKISEHTNANSKDKISLNESGIGPDASIVVDPDQSVGDESGIGKDLCSSSFSDDISYIKNGEVSGTHKKCENSNSICSTIDNSDCNKNGVIKDAESRAVCEHSNSSDNATVKNEVIVTNDSGNLVGMKKDDSGVDFARSSGKDGTSDIDISESQSECGALSVKTDSGVALSSQSKLSENDDSSRELNDSGQILDETGADDEAVPSIGDIDDMEGTSSSEDDDEVILVRTKRTKRRQRSNRVDSSTDDDSSDETGDAGISRNQIDSDSDSEFEVDSKKSNDSESGEEEVYENTNLNESFKAIKELRKREYGYCKQHPMVYFREKVQASANMVKRFKLQSKLDYHEGCVNALHFNRIGTLLASGSDDLNIVLWNWVQQRPALFYDSGHRSNVFQAKFMPFSGDCHVVSCARDGQIRLAELSLTGVCKGTKKLAQHKGAAHKLALELDSPHVFLSCGEDALVYGIDLRQDKPNKLTVTVNDDLRKIPLYSIHSNPANSFEFCVGGRDHFIRIYDKRKIDQNDIHSGLLKKFCPHHLVDSDVKANVTCAVYNYNGSEIIGSYNDEDIYMFNNYHIDGAEYIKRYSGHRNNHTVKGVNFYGPRSEYIVSGSDCGHIFLWEKESEEIIQYLKGDDNGAINVLEPHPTLPILATSGLDHEVKVWLPMDEEPTELKGMKKVMKRNLKQREDERVHDVDMIDGQMLWYIMHHMPRARRRREREAEEGDSSSLDSDNDTSDSDDIPRIPCAPS